MIKTKILLLVGFLFSVLIYSCSNSANNKTKSIKNNISIICLTDSNLIYLKIKNSSDKLIYVPDYNMDFTANSDTIHLNVINKQEYKIDSYYLYKNIFPFNFYTTKKIEGITPDSIESYNTQNTFVNQFRIRPFISISPDSSYVTVLNLTGIPKYKTYIKAVYYYKSFLTPERLERVDYVLDDVVKFDSINANYTEAPILNRYY